MLQKYRDVNTGEIIEAVRFDYKKLDEFFKCFGCSSEKIVFELSAEEKTVTITYPFNEHEDIKAHSGDYLIKGEEIPRSLPYRYHYDVMNGQEFCKKFKPLDVKKRLKQIYDTRKIGFEKIGIKLTDEQFDDLCAINYRIIGNDKYTSVLSILCVLKALGLIPEEMQCEPYSGETDYKNTEDGREYQRKFGFILYEEEGIE